MRAFSLLKLLLLLSFFFDLSSLRTADVFPVVASLPPKNNACEPDRQIDFRERYFSEGEKRRPQIRLRFAGYDLFSIWKSMQTNKQTNKQEQQTKQNFCLEAFKGLFRPQKSWKKFSFLSNSWYIEIANFWLTIYCVTQYRFPWYPAILIR